jgi:hypothetical protein
MSFNGADSIGGTSMNPSNNLGGSSSPHEVTTEDIGVIVGAVVVFVLIVFSVFYYRQLQARRKKATELMEMEHHGNIQDEESMTTKPPRVWKFMGWREPKEANPRASTSQSNRPGRSSLSTLSCVCVVFALTSSSLSCGAL